MIAQTMETMETMEKAEINPVSSQLWFEKNKVDDECSLHKPLGVHFVRTPQGDKSW